MNKKYPIAYFVHNLDSYSGAAQQALLLAKNLDKNILFFNHNNKKYKKHQINDSIKIIDLPKNKILQLFFILYFTFKYQISIYHFHGLFNIALFLGTLLKRKTILKTTLLGDDDFETLASKRSWKVKYFFIKKIHKNIVLSKKLQEINSKYIEPNKIQLIPNGVLVPSRCPTLEAKENSFCFVGLVCKRKRAFESINYFIKNYSQEENSKMYIVGPYTNIDNNNEFDADYVKKCKDLIKNNQLENKIIFTGLLDKKDVQTIFQKCKAMLFFSEKEGMPNVVLEAMASNCVPITCELDGVIREIFNNGEQGFILNDDFVTIPDTSINELIKKKAPYNHIKNNFYIKLIAHLYQDLYEH